MNRVSTFTTNAKSQHANTAEALLKSGNHSRHSDIYSISKEISRNYSSIQTGIDLTQIPVRPAFHTDQQIQCCAKDGAGCSCPKCKAEAEAEKEIDSGEAEEQSETIESQPEQSVSEEPVAEQNPEQVSTDPGSPETQNETDNSPEQTSSTVVVEDSVTDLSQGQMRKTEFLQKLRSSICDTIGPVLATVGQTTEGCPYLNYWLDLYQEKDAAHIEATAKKYAPDVADAKTAEEYISVITQRALRAAEIWARTGKLSGVPKGVPTTLPGESPTENNKEENPVQAKPKNGGVKKADDPKAIKNELGNGEPLSSDVRSRMESAFGTSFSHVRTHTDSTATGLSSEVNARAFTVGNHIAFGNGEYQPGTLLGDALIAHELAHTIQQSSAENSVDKLESGASEYNSLERDADNSAFGVISSLWGDSKETALSRTMTTLRSGLRLQRCDGCGSGGCSTKSGGSSGGAASGSGSTSASVTIPKIRATSTQPGMPDRIPPRVDTPIAVGITGSSTPVVFSIEGAGSGNGSATINGAATASLPTAGTLNLKGVDQTDPGKGGNLKLAAHQGTTKLAESNGFSISSVPQNWKTTFDSVPADPDTVGMEVENCWESDSTNVGDLDKVKRKEQIEVITSTGPFAGATQGTSSWKDATLGCIHDQHFASPKASFRSLGKRETHQVFVFKCERTAVTDITATNSGFVLKRDITAGATAGSFNFDISKVGTATTANGFSSGAASGSAIAPTQAL